MRDEKLMEQAAIITALLPRLMRGLFTIPDDDPGMELPAAQLRVCNILADGRRTMSSIGKELRTSLSAITQIADRLERVGLVSRVAEPDDRRVKSLELTERGAEMMRIRQERRMERTMQAIELLSPESRETLIDSLNMLLQAGIASAPKYNEGS